MPMTQNTASGMMVPNIVKLVNEGDSPFNMRYGPTQRLILAPGESLFVPEEVAWHFTGKWWTDNNNPRLKERATDYNRLRVLYGAYEDDVVWDTARPRLAVFDTQENRITTLVDDPEGLSGGAQTRLGRELSLESQMEILQGQLLEMQAQLSRQAVEREAFAQAEVATDTMPAAAPPVVGPSIPTATVGGTSLPVSIPPIPADDPEPDAGVRLPVRASVAFDPSEVDASEDAPAIMPNGPAPSQGRVVVAGG